MAGKPLKRLTKRGRVAVALCVLATVALGIDSLIGYRAPVWRFDVPAVVPHRGADAPAPLFEVRYLYEKRDGVAHAPSLFMRQGGEVELFWFDGAREGGRDVTLRHALLSRDGAGGWRASADGEVAAPDDLQARIRPRQSVRTIGNTIIGRLDGGEAVRFVTTVSVGGWSMAKIAMVGDPGRPASDALADRHLPLSPLLNRSSLVRSPTVRFEGGNTGLPFYQEMLGAFSELALIAPDGRVVDKSRITRGRGAIQPSIVALDETRAIALMRNFGAGHDRLVMARTSDGGRSWDDPVALGLPNPNSPVAAIRLDTGDIVMVFNDHPTRRDILRLALSRDEGASWQRIHTLEDGAARGGGDARYPTLQRHPDGTYFLTYSLRSKRAIKLIEFNESWVYQAAGRS